VTYVAESLVVELDGRLFHDNATARDKDMDRDLDAAVDGLNTVRVGWGQVFRRPCMTAQRIGRLLQRNGWTGSPARCPDCDPSTVPPSGVT
jgi:very-short-patch-repair endonuclease